MTSDESGYIDAAQQQASGFGFRRILAAGLLCTATVYLGFFIARQWTELRAELARFEMSALVAAALAIVTMLALKSVYHVVAIRRLGNMHGPPAPRIVAAYAASQVVRYLPGKVLGVYYEVSRLAGEVRAYRVIAANVVQGVHTTALTIGIVVAATAWIWSQSVSAAIGVLALVVAASWVAHHMHLAERLLSWLATRVRRFRSVAALTRTIHSGALSAVTILLVEWVPYYVFWWIVLPTGPGVLNQAIVLGTCYAAASMIANFAIIMPAGLIVREALFLWVGTLFSLEPAYLIALGMISRFLFTAADLAFALMAMGWERFSEGRSR